MLILDLVGVKHKEIFYYLSISLSGPNLRYLVYSERLIKSDLVMANKGERYLILDESRMGNCALNWMVNQNV